jgi:hypothetical protein
MFWHHSLVIFKSNLIRRDVIFRTRRINNYLRRRVLSFVGWRFLFAGFTSWKQENFYIDSTIRTIPFLPNGIVLCFYGSLAFVTGLYLFFRIISSSGIGFNEYNRKDRQVHIFRWGFPGSMRRIEFTCLFSELESLYLESKNQIINLTDLNLYLLDKNQRKILLTPSDRLELRSPQEMEFFATNLAQFLKIPLIGNFLF